MRTRLVPLVLCLFALFSLCTTTVQAHTAQPSVAFYYGKNPPANMLSQFDWVVVEANNVNSHQLKVMRRHGTRVFAYVSLGEAESWRPGFKALNRSVIRTKDKAWNTDVVDLTKPGWKAYILNKRIAPLWKEGYRGFFLDTLDSFKLFAKNKQAVDRQRKALVELIKAIHHQFPGIRLFLNRGFSILPKVHNDVVGVAAESLFKGWDPENKTYRNVPQAQQKALIQKLDHVKKAYHLPVTVIAYLPPRKREKARQIAHKIANLGFTPWITDAQLNEMGVGSIEVMPRKVLMLYHLSGQKDELALHSIEENAAMPLEYLGYAAKYHAMRKPLPETPLRGRYAGIVTWFSGNVPDPSKYEKWLKKQIHEGVHVAILGDPGLPDTSKLFNSLGLTALSTSGDGPRVISHDDMVDFEGLPRHGPGYETGLQTRSNQNKEHLVLKDARGQRLSPVVTGPWGGIALSPWVLENIGEIRTLNKDDRGSAARQRWIINPFRFFKTALQLPEIPIPDATTENGNRILMSQIDGDGFANRARLPGTPFDGKVILDRILRKYPLPITVSVIEGEIGPQGLHPGISPQLEQIARAIFKLPNVEIASHTYSHPFDWEAMKNGMPSGKYNLPIPGYHFSFKRDIEGSVQYINNDLAPAGKKTRVLLWSGDALPPKKAVAMTYQMGIANLNGGNTTITRLHSSLTNVSAMLRVVGPYLQVYAPDMNEDIFTHGYTGPYWGFEHVIQTFKMTNKPRRLKPMDIYYHFYSGTRIASLRALRKVYEYAMHQHTLPMFESQYFKVATDFYRLGIARTLNGAWRITGAAADRTLRLPSSMGWPDIAHSTGVAGVRNLPQGRYVALTGADHVTLVLTRHKPVQPYLIKANGRITQWQRRGHELRIRLHADVGLKFSLANTTKCHIHAPGAQMKKTASATAFTYTGTSSGHVVIRCP